MNIEKSGLEMSNFSPMRSIVPFMLLVRMISSGVDFIFCATRAMTSPFFTMYSCFSGEGTGEKRMSMLTAPSRSFASSKCWPLGYFWMKAKSHFMQTPLPASSDHRDSNAGRVLPKSLVSVRVGPRENHVPEARNLSFGLVRPGKVAIVTIKSFRKNLESKENACDCRGEKFPSHLRIFDIGRFALRATQRRSDVGIGDFPFPHQLVRFPEIIFVHFHFHVCPRLCHESDALQMAVADNVGTDPCLSQPVAQMFGFRLLVEGCDRDHGFGSGLAAS